VSVAGDFELRDPDSGTVVHRGRARTLAPAAWLAGRAALRLCPAEGDLRIGTARYPGDLLLLARAGEDGCDLVLETDVESYLPGVLAGELSADFPAAALRCQAIASRTYVLHQVEVAAAERPWHVSDDHMSQVFLGIPPASGEVFRRAVAETRGLVLLWRGHPLCAYFHSTCGGHTADATEVFGDEPSPPLAGTPCEFCRASGYYRWKETFPAAEAGQVLGLGGPVTAARIGTRDRGGRALTLDFAGVRTVRIPAADVRFRLGTSRLYSTLIRTIAVREGELVVEGAGWGHGVGMCQMGARGLALAGLGAADILAHYYPGAGLFRLY
jgi:stage II sporulation protein D